MAGERMRGRGERGRAVSRSGRGTVAGGVQKGAEDHGEAQGRARSVRGGRRRRQRTRERERGRGSPSPVVEQSLLEEESGLARRGDDEVAVAEAFRAASRRRGWSTGSGRRGKVR